MTGASESEELDSLLLSFRASAVFLISMYLAQALIRRLLFVVFGMAVGDRGRKM